MAMICTAPPRFAFINLLYDCISIQRLVTSGSHSGHLGWCVGCFRAHNRQFNFCKFNKPNIFLCIKTTLKKNNLAQNRKAQVFLSQDTKPIRSSAQILNISNIKRVAFFQTIFKGVGGG